VPLHSRAPRRYPWLVERIIVDLGKDWLSVADVCEYMGVSPFVVTRVLRAGDLPAVKIGREWRISRVDFEDWLNEQRLNSPSPTRTR
jgi:excisionase family DNA binding protein